jgi:calcium-dependent protein kinase
MVSNLTTKKDQETLRETFKMFDKNGDGKIELDEFIQSYSAVYKDIPRDKVAEEAERFFKAIDTDGNGSIDFTEWCAATIDKHKLINE